MRAYQLRKLQATEEAIDKLRRGLAGGWSMLTEVDLDDLSWALGELWSYEKRVDWQELRFSTLALTDVLHILELARVLRADPKDTVETLEHIGDIVRAAGQA